MGTRARAEQFALLLDGGDVAGLDPRVASLGGLAGRLAAIPTPPLPARLAAGSAVALATARLGHATAYAAPAKNGLVAGKLAALKAATVPAWAVGAAGFSAAAIAVVGVATVATTPTGHPANSRLAGRPSVTTTHSAAPHATPKHAAAALTVEDANVTLASVARALSASAPDTAALHRLAMTWAAQATAGVATLTAQGTPAALAKATSFVQSSKAAIAAAAAGMSPAVVKALTPAISALAAVTQKVATLPHTVAAIPSLVPSVLPTHVSLPIGKAPAVVLPSLPVPLPSVPGIHLP